MADVDLTEVISAPRPQYPYETRRANITGSGIVTIEVEPATGRVKNAYMDPSTGSVILDNAALFALRRWRFKPGKVTRARQPITFTMGEAAHRIAYLLRLIPSGISGGGALRRLRLFP